MEINKCQNFNVFNFNTFTMLIINCVITLFYLVINFYVFMTNEYINFTKIQRFLYEIIIINIIMLMYFVLFGYSITLFIC